MSNKPFIRSTDKKALAIALRQLGWSYKEIVKEIHVSMSSLSLWLRGIELSPSQQERLDRKEREHCKLGGERTRQEWESRRQAIAETYNPPLQDPNFMLGLGLYWGEGKKCSESAVTLSNTSAELLRAFIAWIKRFFADEHQGFTVYIQHHRGEEMDDEVVQYWSHELKLPVSCFSKCFHVKPRSDRPPRRIGYGVAHVTVCGQGVWIIRQQIKIAIQRIASLT